MMQSTRRQALKGLTLGAGATLLNPLIQRVVAQSEGRSDTPPRFVFVLQSNGFDAIQACPPTIPFQPYADRNRFQSFDLTQHALPQGLAPLERHKKRVTVLQGLSGKCTGGGHSVQSGALGQFRLSGANSSPLGITIDYQLGQAVPGILPWIGVGMSANARRTATLQFAARAPHKPLAIALNPEKAYRAYFSVAAKGDLKKRFHLKRNLLDYMIGDVKRTQKQLGALGGVELEAYLDAYDSLAKRQYRLLGAERQLSQAAPAPDDRFHSAVATQRLEAQFEIAACALIGGLSNVATITSAAGEINAQPYLGIGIEESNHGYGHMGGNRRDARGIPFYEKSRGFVMGLIAKMVDRLESMPEGNGTMMDKTLIVYMSDAPDTHHSTAMEWPLLLVGDLGGRLQLGGHYINSPGYGKPGHRTVGSFYSTLLHAAGVPQDTFGRLDPDLDEAAMQTGPCPELLA
ncbi:MAG: DUF1552 domain-containing protein [Planctomycetaceae bacterium]